MRFFSERQRHEFDHAEFIFRRDVALSGDSLMRLAALCASQYRSMDVRLALALDYASWLGLPLRGLQRALDIPMTPAWRDDWLTTAEICRRRLIEAIEHSTYGDLASRKVISEMDDTIFVVKHMPMLMWKRRPWRPASLCGERK
jgi:hypothetical protein